MRRTGDRTTGKCWVDFFEGPYFAGRMRRVFGPATVQVTSASSLIVGPGATVRLRATAHGAKHTLLLQSKSVIADLRPASADADRWTASITCACSPLTARTSTRLGQPSRISPDRDRQASSPFPTRASERIGELSRTLPHQGRASRYLLC